VTGDAFVLDAIDDDATYLVKLKRVVSYGRAELRPLGEHQMLGRVLKEIAAKEGEDVIDSVKKLGDD
jgi:hypothetical protein